ncbi:hypothetical protein [Catenulispora subtropica]|uniref:Uncharacterized protein n=1 Tax=Catenulispora subtropica TaxID=450798 RepID=A0ABP5CPR5_9ACTN
MSSWALPQRTDQESRYSRLRHAADLNAVARWYMDRDAAAIEAGLMPESWRMTPEQAWEYAEMYWRERVEQDASGDVTAQP